MDKTEVRAFLRQVQKVDAQLDCRLAERQQWQDRACQITAAMGGACVKSSGSSRKMADALDKCTDAEQQIDLAVAELVQCKASAVAAIDMVENPIELKVLHMRYIRHMNLQDIADAFQKDYGWATTVHGRAIESLQKVMDKSL